MLLATDIRLRAKRVGLRLRVEPDGTITILDARTKAGSRVVRLALKHAPYAYDVVACFDYTHDAVNPEVVDGVQIVDFSSSRLHRLRGSGELFRFTGLPEPEATTQVYLDHAALRPGDLVLDLGAYCGASTAAFARAVGPTGHVLAIEPDPANAAALRENIQRHALNNVTVREAGVWSVNMKLPFAAEGNMGSALGSLLPRAASTHIVDVIDLETAMQDACALSRLPRVAFIKMDIEGAEIEVLKSSEWVLRQHAPRLAIEPHAVHMARRTAEMTRRSMVEMLSMWGYRCDLSTQGTGGHTIVLASPRSPTETRGRL